MGSVYTSYGLKLFVSDGKLYVSGELYSDLRVLDLSDPVVPSELWGITFSGSGAGPMVRAGNRILSVGWSPDPFALHIIELGNEMMPPIESSPVGFGGRCIRVNGNRAYIGGGNPQGIVRVVDVSAPASPAVLGQISLPSRVYGLDIQGTTVFAAGSTSGLKILDASNPVSPQILGSADTPGDAQAVSVAGTLAFVADGYSGIAVVHVADPSMPAVIHQHPTGDFASDVLVDGTIAYVCNGEAGLLILDVTNPLAPVTLGTLDTPGFSSGMDRVGTTLFIADAWEGGLRIVDISNPENLVLLGSSDTPGYAGKVTISGNMAIVADGYVTFIDVSYPAQPVPIGVHFDTWSNGCAVVGDRLYAVSLSGLDLIGLPCATSSAPILPGPPVGLVIGPPWPNPFSDSVSMSYRLDRSGSLRAFVTGIRGSRVRILDGGIVSPGTGILTWDGRDDAGAALPAGVYFMTVVTGNGVATRRVVRLH